MKRVLDPLRLDVEAACRAAATLQGEWPIAVLERLLASAHPESPPAAGATIEWSARAEHRSAAGGAAQCWLHLRAAGRIDLVCQRCLGPVPTELRAERSFAFVHGEEQAAALDAEIEDDVLALTRSLNLRELVEDELLLSMPLVPRHEVCPDPPVLEHPGDIDDERPNPFASLRGLRGVSD
jgi:uncharacterized protein